jgi:hypothetical protein
MAMESSTSVQLSGARSSSVGSSSDGRIAHQMKLASAITPALTSAAT